MKKTYMLVAAGELRIGNTIVHGDHAGVIVGVEAQYREGSKRYISILLSGHNGKKIPMRISANQLVWRAEE